MQAIALSLASVARPGVALGVLVPLLVAVASTSLNAAELTLEEIRATLRELETSTTSISIRYTLLAGTGRPHDYEYEFQKSGNAVRLKQWGPEIGTMLSVFDGATGYEVAYESPDSTKVKRIIKAAAIPLELSGGHNPLRWWGFQMPGGVDRPLHELLERGRITGQDRAGEFDVVNIDLGACDTVYEGISYEKVQCQLSPQHDYCPVAIRLWSRGPGEETFLYNYAVSEFRRVPHPLLAREVWMPSRMTFGDRTEFRVDEVELNPDIPPAMFVPQPEVGTQIIDETAPGGRKQWVHAAAEARRQAIQHSASQPPPVIPSAPLEPVIATPSTGWPLATYLWFIPVIVLIAIVAIRFTRSGS